MTEYIVPENGLDAAWGSYLCNVMRKGPNYSKDTLSIDPIDREARKESVKAALEGFIRWQSENPRVPTVEQANELWEESCRAARASCNVFPIVDVFAKRQRRMYLVPEPEVPEGIKDLLVGVHPDVTPIAIEAYRRGQKAGK